MFLTTLLTLIVIWFAISIPVSLGMGQLLTRATQFELEFAE